MNWTGGARYRIRTQDERKLQKEFFDRKRLGAIKSVCNRTSRKKGVSQDLLALHTVSRAHSKGKQDEAGQKSIKRIDLDRFQSCTKRIEEVDMGPSSPTPTQSRLLLMESKSNMNNSTTETAKLTLQHGSETAFLKPESLSVHVGKFDKSDKDHPSKDSHTHSNRNHRHSSGTDHMQNPRQSSRTDQWMKNNSREHVSSYSDESRDKFDHSFRFSKDGKKPQFKYDPFASEDFQITPLRKYSKNDVPVTQTHDNSRKRECPQSLQEWDMCGTGESNPKHANTSHSDTYFTSTPVENLDRFKLPAKSKDKFNFSVFEDSFSPIPKLSRHIPEVEDDFQYQPRPMINTPETFKARSITPVLSIASATVKNIQTPENPSKYLTFSCGNDSSQYEPETILSSSKVREHHFYETSSKESYLESVKRNNIFLQCSSEDPVAQLFNVQGSPRVSSKQRNEKIHSGSKSSLLQYRQKFRHYKTELNLSDQQSKETERFNMTSTQLHVNKSKEPKNLFCSDSEPEIQYKPFKKLTSDKERKTDIMRLYQDHKGTDVREGSLWQNCTVMSQSMPTTHQLEETEHQLEETHTKVRRLSGREAANYASSPKIGEDYPAHLNYQSTASENAEQISKEEVPMNQSQDGWHTPDVKRIDTKRKQTGDDSSSIANSHMEEVLQEMKELEQQDSVIQDEISEDSCNNPNQMSACQVERSTEICETDHFLDSERKFWNLQGIDDMVLQGSTDNMSFVGNETTAMVQNKVILFSQTTSETKFTDGTFEGMKEQTDLKEFGNSKSVDIEKTDMVKSAGTAESQELFQQQNKGDILNEHITELPINGERIIDDSIKAQSVSCSYKEMYGHKNQPDEIKSPLSFVQQAVVTVKRDDEVSTKSIQSEVKYVPDQIVEDNVASGIAAVCQVTENQSVAAADFKETGLKTLDIGARTDPCIEESKTFKTPEHTTSCDSILDSNIENGCINISASKNSKYLMNLKSDNHQTEVTSLQDPQVSSGCNQGVQTDCVQCIDMASSPFALCHSPTTTKSVGIQCNFDLGKKMAAKNATTKIPMLGALASNLLGSSYCKGLSFVSFFNKNLGSSSSDTMTTHKLQNANSQKELSDSVLDFDSKSHQIDGTNSAVPESEGTPDIGKKENGLII